MAMSTCKSTCGERSAGNELTSAPKGAAASAPETRVNTPYFQSERPPSQATANLSYHKFLLVTQNGRGSWRFSYSGRCEGQGELKYSHERSGNEPLVYIELPRLDKAKNRWRNEAVRALEDDLWMHKVLRIVVVHVYADTVKLGLIQGDPIARSTWDAPLLVELPKAPSTVVSVEVPMAPSTVVSVEVPMAPSTVVSVEVPMASSTVKASRRSPRRCRSPSPPPPPPPPPPCPWRS